MTIPSQVFGNLKVSRGAYLCVRATMIANWDAAIYCAWVARDSIVVGQIKRRLSNEDRPT